MIPFRQTSGIREGRVVARGLSALVLASALSGCFYGFQAGAGFPDHVKTVAIVPFELGPRITRPEIADEIFALLLREFPRSQGLQPAGEDVADAVVRGEIVDYSVSTPSYRAGAAGEVPTVLQRQVVLRVSVEIINLVDNEILWQNSSVSVQAEYLEEGGTEDEGRAAAIELLVQRIVDGAQSNW